MDTGVRPEAGTPAERVRKWYLLWRRMQGGGWTDSLSAGLGLRVFLSCFIITGCFVVECAVGVIKDVLASVQQSLGCVDVYWCWMLAQIQFGFPCK